MATPFPPSNLLPMLELSTDQFVYHADDRMFVAHTSALLLPGEPGTWWLQQLYRDDPDTQGVCLRSHRTGNVKRFVLVYRKMKRDWCHAWLFDAADDPTLHVLIINDACPVFENVEVRAD